MRSVRPPHVGRVGGAAPAPPLRVESLEDRTTPATLYVITHGLQGTDSPPAWVFDLAEAIDARTGNRFSTDQINASVLRATDPPGSGVPPGGAADFLIFDWASLSRSAGTADDPEVAGALANFVRNRLPASGFQDVHFIGHGRGALVNSAAAALLNNPADNARIGRLQVTLLDPQALGADGQTGGSLTLTPNVDWADAFFQTGAVIPGGARVSVPSAAPLDITAQLQAWSGRSGTLADHEEVHDWYHWTVDLADTVQAPYLRDAALQAQKALFTAQAQGGGSGPNVRDLLYGENVDLDLDGSPDSLFGGSGIGFHFSVGQALGAQSLAGFGSLDLVLVIDATSSMFDDIEAVRRAASELVSTLRLHVPDFRLGIVTYRDLPQAPFGAPGDYQSRTDLAFTNETRAILDALNGLRIGGGGDTAESVYSGLVRAIDGGPDLGGWRNGVRRAIVLMGDAPPHDPEPGTGFTRQSVTVRAIEQGISISTIRSGNNPDTGSGFESIADVNDGGSSTAGSADALPPALDATIREIIRPLNASALLPRVFTVGAGEGGGPRVRAFGPGLEEEFSDIVFNPAFLGGVRATARDLTADTVPDIIVAAGPGAEPRIDVFDGANGDGLGGWLAFEQSFTGGVFITAGDLDGDGFAEVITSPDRGGGPRVRIFSGANPDVVLADFFGIEDPAFRGGARVALADVNGDGVLDVLVGAGFGGGPRLAVFDGRQVLTPLGEGQLQPAKLFPDFFVFENTLRNGVFLTGGDITGDGFAEVIVGGGPGGGPRVFALDGADLVASGGTQQTPRANFFFGDTSARGGIRVAVVNFDGDNRADLVLGAGEGDGSGVSVFAGTTLAAEAEPSPLHSFDAFPGLIGGVYVG